MHARPDGSEAMTAKPTNDALLNLNRRQLGLTLFAGYALGAGPLNAASITTSSDELITRTLGYRGQDGANLRAFLAMPSAIKKRPVIVVMSEVFGLHEYIRDVCRRLAKAGFVAIAPDLFSRAADPAPLQNFEEIKTIVATATEKQVKSDLSATLDYLATRPDVGQGQDLFGRQKTFADLSKVGITGFCWGGASVWMAAAEEPRIRAGVAWYGRLKRPATDQFLGQEDRPWPLDVVKSLHAPVLGLYAGKDGGIPLSDVEAMRAALKTSPVPVSDIIVYENAQHGFHADYRQTYDEEAASDGWKRLMAWFGAYL